MSGKKKRTITSRDLSTMTFIVLALCGAASVMMFGPVRHRETQANLALEEAHRAAQLAPSLLIESVAWREEEARGKAMQDYVAKHSTGAIDSAALTQRLYDMATICGLELSRIRPSAKHINAGKNADGASKSAPQAALRVSLDTTADYQAVVRFLDSLETDFGFVRIETVRLTPVTSAGKPLVRATIESVHFAFDPALAEPKLTPEGMTTMSLQTMATPGGQP